MINVDKIFVIVTQHDVSVSEDDMRKRLHQLPWSVPMEIVQIQSGPEDLTSSEPMTSSTQIWQMVMRHSEVDLLRTHFKIWQKAYEDNLSYIVVLNDNVEIAKTHFHVLDTDEPWDLMYLGRESFAGDHPVEGGLVIPGYSDGTYAYLIRQSGIKKLISSHDKEFKVSVQDIFAAKQGTHPDSSIASEFEPDLFVLAPMRNFIERVPEIESDQREYSPLHPMLFDYEGDHWVRRYVNPQIVDKEFDLICDEPVPNVYTFPLFSLTFCKEIIEEAEHYGSWTNYRYKDDASHASIDLMLTSIGFDEIYKDVLRRFVHPLFQHKYQLNPQISEGLDSQHFVVRYLADEQRHLGLHNDACDISMIVTLNTEFDGGGTFFPKFGKLIRPDQPGHASIHPGFIGYTHGARPITRGRRYILASFFFRK